HDRQIGRGIGADDLGAERAVVGQLDLHVVHALHDVVVGQDVAILAGDDAGAEPALERTRLPLSALRPLVAEEAAELLGDLLVRPRPGPLRASSWPPCPITWAGAGLNPSPSRRPERGGAAR